MPFDPNKTGVFHPYKPRKWPSVAVGLAAIVLAILILLLLIERV